tara:strand:- start:483 stop:752 length:270 start_codon:yes stop_codon:yes gene_type:complete
MRTQMSRKKANPYDPVWYATREAGFESKVVRQALSLVPPKPVVDSKVKKKTTGPVPVPVGNFIFHHDSWQALQSQYVSLVLMVCSMLSE